MYRRFYISMGLLTTVLLGGCAAPSRLPASQPVSALNEEKPNPQRNPRAELTIDQIKPELRLPPASPPPSTRPTLDQLTLYARARLAMHRNQTFTAINLLEKLTRQDPDALDPLLDLARVYSATPGQQRQAIQTLERAAAIKPNHMLIYTELARLHINAQRPDRAIESLLLARQTTDYRDNHPEAALVDYRLAALLDEAGYDRAALDLYRQLQRRLAYPTHAMRRLRDLQDLIERPHLLDLAIARVHEKRNEPLLALAAYERVLPHQPDDLSLHAAVIEALLASRQPRAAMARAVEVVRRFDGSLQSIALLKQTYARAGRGTTIAADLAGMHRRSPADRAILLTLVDVHIDQGRVDQALALIQQAWDRQPDDLALADRLISLLLERGQEQKAAAVVVQILAHRPDALDALGSSVQVLFDPITGLRPAEIEHLPTSPDTASIRLYLAARVAQQQGRSALTRSLLERAAKARPVFASAVRGLLSTMEDPAERQSALEALEDEMDPALRLEMRADHLIRAGKHQEALDLLDPIVRQPTATQELRLLHALALQLGGREVDFERALRRAIAYAPTHPDAYLLLINHFRQANRPVETVRLIRQWMESDPASTPARLQQIIELIRLGRVEDAQRLLDALFEQAPTDSTVLTTLVSYYSGADGLPRAIRLIEAAWRKHPTSRALVGALVELHAQSGDENRAAAVVAQAREDGQHDPDWLYFVAHLYHRLHQPQMSQQVLEQVLRLKPAHAPASNDLGYALADAGKRLDEAERLIRHAVDVEPDNASYLDSLGWVLYKRGSFAEATQWLQRAVEASDEPDPIVLDHLGDALWRLKRHEEAVEQWRQALLRVEAQGASRPDLVELKTQLERKLQQITAGQDVNVAPVVGAGEQQAAGGRQ